MKNINNIMNGFQMFAQVIIAQVTLTYTDSSTHGTIKLNVEHNSRKFQIE